MTVDDIKIDHKGHDRRTSKPVETVFVDLEWKAGEHAETQKL